MAQESEKRGRRNQQLGRKGEATAVRFLEMLGYEVLARNWRCHAGEADIIARDGDVLVFVEVKTRKSCHKGLPEEAVTAEKKARYQKIALAFITKYDTGDMRLRYDVVAITVLGDGLCSIRHNIHAYGEDEV